jgi:hypothetical protein
MAGERAPIDFSEFSDSALKYGVAPARTFGASLHLLQVVTAPLRPQPQLPNECDGRDARFRSPCTAAFRIGLPTFDITTQFDGFNPPSNGRIEG